MKTDTPVRLALFCSGSGSNAEAIMDYFQHSQQVEVALLLANKPEAFALQRAERRGVPHRVFSRSQFTETGEVLAWLHEARIDYLILAGFLWKVPLSLLEAFPQRIINIHPALLPKYGGKGMYGMYVHQAVYEAREPETGITIHLVTENYDEGPPLFQASVALQPSDTPESIAQKVHSLEHRHFPRVIEEYIRQQRGF